VLVDERDDHTALADARRDALDRAAAYVAGAIRSQIGSYDDAFLMSGLLCLVAAGLILTIGRAIAAKASTRVAVAKPA
jgi:hypothetical protein